jgi:hypothetical protein
MKMPGYWVSRMDEGVSLTQTVFDETVSTPPLSGGRPIRTKTLMFPFAGTLPLEAALACARQSLPETRAAFDVVLGA